MDNLNEHYVNQSHNQYENNPQDRPHSGIGIASFILSSVAWLATIVMFFVSFSALRDTFDYMLTLDPDSSAYSDEVISWFDTYANTGLVMGFSFVLTVAGGLVFIGLILGLIGLFTKDRKKLFPILGTILSGIPFIIPIFGLLVGTMI